MATDAEIAAAAAVLANNALDMAGRRFDDARARALAQVVLADAEAQRKPPTVPAFRATE
jgi:hypothetical protein